MKPLRSDPHEIARTLGALFRPGDVIEIRIPKTAREGVVAGYFDDWTRLVKSVVARNGDPGIYVTLNPVNPALLSRYHNRLQSRAATTTSDRDIIRRGLLLIDADPVRPAGICSTDAEHNAALEKVREIRAVLAEEGWPTPILADSGNGGHLLWGIDLPNDEAATKLVEAVLKALAARFSDATVKVDVTMGNAARITKLYGTVVRKGDSTADRPHRISRIIDVPAILEPAPRELLEELAQMAAPKANTDSKTQSDVETFISRYLEAQDPISFRGGRKWLLNECPFDSSHQKDAAIYENADGTPGFKCFHNTCAGKTWKDVRQRFEPRPQNQRDTQTVGRLEPPPVLTYCALKKVETQVTQMLFAEYSVPASGATLMLGQSKAGKTVLAVQQALALARAKPLFDNYRTLKPGPVMVVEQDDPGGAASIRDLVEHSGGGPDDMPFFTVPKLQFGFGAALLDWLAKEITARKLVMVVLDSYTALRGPRGGGIDVVKAEQTELSQLDELGKRLQSAIVIIHHDSTGKAQRGLEWTQSAAGTYAMTMATEAQVHVARFAELDIKAPERLVRMRGRHSADLHLVLRFRAATEDYEHVLENSAAASYPLMRQLQDEFGKAVFGPKDLTQATGVSYATAKRQIERLRFAGAIHKNGRGEYMLSVSL